SVKHAANRRISPRPRSTWPSSSAPAFEVMSPPSNPATTARRSTASNSNSVGVHSVGIGALRETERYCCCTTLFSDSQPRCTPQFEKSGLGARGIAPSEFQDWLDRQPTHVGRSAMLHVWMGH